MKKTRGNLVANWYMLQKVVACPSSALPYQHTNKLCFTLVMKAVILLVLVFAAIAYADIWSNCGML